MGAIAAISAFILVWGIAIAVAGFQIREPDVAAIGTFIASISVATLTWVLSRATAKAIRDRETE